MRKNGNNDCKPKETSRMQMIREKEGFWKPVLALLLAEHLRLLSKDRKDFRVL